MGSNMPSETSPQEFVRKIRSQLENEGWQLVGSKQTSGVVIFKASQNGTSSITMVVPSNNDNVTEEHIKYLLKLHGNTGVDTMFIASQCGYSPAAQQIIEANSIDEVTLEESSSQTNTLSSTKSSSSGESISRRTALLGGGILGLGGIALFSERISNTIGSVFNSVSRDTIATVERSVDDDDNRQLTVELTDESLITNIALRDSDGEIVQRADATPGATHATIPVWGGGDSLDAGEYEIVVTDDEETVDTEPIELTTGDVEITGVRMVAPAEGDNRGFTLLYTNFEVEIDISEGDLPVQLLDGGITDGVPNPTTTFDSMGGDVHIMPGDTYSYSFPRGDSDTGSFPVAIGRYGSSTESFECTGESEIATGVLEFSEPGSDDAYQKEIEIEYVIDGEFTRGGHDSHQEGCTEGHVLDWNET